MDVIKQVNDYLEALKRTIDNLNRAEIDNIIKILIDAYNKDSSIIIFGNGGSASTASHFACDINKGVSYGLEKRFRIIPLTDNIATITAYANDTDYHDIFVEQIKNYLREGDVVIGISGSGNSKNVLKAIEYANSKGYTTIGFTGYNGGKLRGTASYSVNANINDMQISEDIHMILVHILMKVLKMAIGSTV